MDNKNENIKIIFRKKKDTPYFLNSQHQYVQFFCSQNIYSTHEIKENIFCFIDNYCRTTNGTRKFTKKKLNMLGHVQCMNNLYTEGKLRTDESLSQGYQDCLKTRTSKLYKCYLHENTVYYFSDSQFGLLECQLSKHVS